MPPECVNTCGGFSFLPTRQGWNYGRPVDRPADRTPEQLADATGVWSIGRELAPQTCKDLPREVGPY